MTTTKKKTTTDSSLRSGVWRPRTGAAIALVLLLAACSTTSEPAADTALRETAPTTAGQSTTIAPPDPAELLAESLEQYSNGYEFSASAGVNDQEATVQTGRWLAGASEITVRSGDGEAEYIITPESQWVRLTDGEWEEIDTSPPVLFPLEPMATPNSIELIAFSGNRASGRALYPAAAVGLTGDPVEVILDFEDGLLVGISFTAEVDGNAVESATSLSPLTDTTPILAPTE